MISVFFYDMDHWTVFCTAIKVFFFFFIIHVHKYQNNHYAIERWMHAKKKKKALHSLAQKISPLEKQIIFFDQ